jgi:hypothetical protein
MQTAKPEICAVCGDTITGMPINVWIEGKEYVLDRDECVLLLRKFLKIYGKDFKFILNP